MKFDLGETTTEKLERIKNWHRIFAWLPHRVDSHDCRWLEYIERRGTVRSWIHNIIDWEYRLIGEQNGKN